MTKTRLGLVALACAAGLALAAGPAQAGGGVQLHVHLWEPFVSALYVVPPPRVVYRQSVGYHHHQWRGWRPLHHDGHPHRHHHYGHSYTHAYRHSGHRRHH